MRNRIVNLTTDGTWQTLGTDLNFPKSTFTVVIQVRPVADAYFRFAGQEEYMTIKSGGFARLEGKYDPGDLQVRAAVGTVLELMFSTNLLDIGR